jgi:inorganic pyrophosphatase
MKVRRQKADARCFFCVLVGAANAGVRTVLWAQHELEDAKLKGNAEKRRLSHKEKMIEVIIETPRGRRNKFKFDPKHNRFCLGSVLPAGSAFPYDFGFIPETIGEDGDPLDVLLLMDESAFPGCAVCARIIGILEAEQTDDDETVRNDRIIAVAHDAHDYGQLKSIKDVNPNLLKELEHFFISYNEIRGKRFKLLAARGPKPAMRRIVESHRRPKKSARHASNKSPRTKPSRRHAK